MRSHKMDGKRMRAHNAERVLRDLRSCGGTLSRADLARNTSLSPPTVSALVDELLRTGLVKEHGEGTSRGGRKPQLIRFNAGCGVVLGANIDANQVQLAVADMNGEMLQKLTVELPNDRRPKPVLRRVATAAQKMLRETGQTETPLLAAVVGAPGMTDVERGIVLEAANLEGWRDVPARDLLAGMLNVPVVVDNDVNLAAVGEQWKGVAAGAHDFVFISLGTGIGAGVVIDNKLHRGHRFYAGEISHLNVDFSEWEKDFGAAGYLETYLTETRRNKGRNSGRTNLDDETVARLGAAIANIATLLDPQLIIFGGRRATKDENLLARLQAVAARIAPNCPELRLTELGEDATLFGSIRVALEIANESLHQLMREHATTAA